MKDYTNSKKIAEYLMNYKELKKKEKEYSNDAAVEAVLSTKSEEERKSFTNTMVEVEVKKKEFAGEKKEVKTLIDECSRLISDTLDADLRANPSNLKEDTISFTGIGSVKYTKVTKIEYQGTEEERKELIEHIINDGLYDLLSINEEKLVEMSKEIKERTGKHVPGVTEYDIYETKITTR